MAIIRKIAFKIFKQHRYKFIHVNPLLHFLKKKRGFRVLGFHQIEDLESFRQICEHVKTHYTVLAPADFHKNNRLNGVIFTFDDGFHSNIDAVKQTLNPLGIKAVFFVPAAFIESKGIKKEMILNNIFPAESLKRIKKSAIEPMSWNDVQFLVDTGHTIGAHTFTHLRLSQITNKNELEREIVGSGEVFENRFGIKVDWFAYPFGNADSISEEAFSIICRKYRKCCTLIGGGNHPNNNQFFYWRDSIQAYYPPDYVRFILEGGLDLYFLLQRQKVYKMNRSLVSTS